MTAKYCQCRTSQRTETISKSHASGNLRIGDHWNAITIIALSQSNPLKAVAELVENSIDARAKTIVITRGKEKGQHYLRVKDDGEGVRKNADGEPDFHYVATHVCDSIKRRLKTQGMRGLQGEFGKMLKLRYICRLFAKELVLKNFVGIPQDQLLERLLELTLYTEENLR